MTPLVLEDVSRQFHKDGRAIRVLERVNLRVEAGACISVQGPSGCGKSTLLMLAGGLLRPTAGRVMLGDQDVYALAPSRRAACRGQRVGFVFQRFCLIPYLSVRDNVLSSALTTHEPGLTDRAEELIDRVGLTDRLHHTPAELSAGEQQRAALARALLRRPALVLADEPTGNLDPASAATVTAVLREHATEGGAVLMATHAPATAACATRHLRLAQGQLEPIHASPDSPAG